MKKLKRMVFGEKMPDKDDPKYRARYERDVEAGRRFCHATRLDKCAAAVQRFANRHRKVFFTIVIAIMSACFVYSIGRIAMVTRMRGRTRPAVEMQDSVMKARKTLPIPTTSIKYK